MLGATVGMVTYMLADIPSCYGMYSGSTMV